MRLRIVGVYVATCCNMLQYGQYRVYLWTWSGQEAPQATPAEPLRQEGNLGCHGAVIYGHLHRSSQHFCPSMSILSMSMLMLLAPVLELIFKRPKSSRLAMKIYVLILGAVHAANNADKCVFPNTPRVPYYWDENCKLGLLRNTSVCHFESCHFS